MIHRLFVLPLLLLVSTLAAHS
ncbi:MAG: hypothetical protein RL015_2931, partial [Verrucomicrobiota bacterium]